MSLDLTLHSPTLVDKTCFHCGSRYQEVEELFNANITHNLGEMARKAGIYHYLWRPEEIDITFASELIDPLTLGLEELKENPDTYKKLNPKNGWGCYEGFVEWVERYLEACKENPDALINVSR